MRGRKANQRAKVIADMPHGRVKQQQLSEVVLLGLVGFGLES